MSTDPTVLTKYLDPLNVPPVVNADANGRITVGMTNATVQLHSQLPASQAWTYDGQVPGPTIEVQKGETVHIDWVNQLSGSLPLDVVTGAGALSENVPGQADGTLDTTVPGIPPYTVVHLHGAQAGSNSDGWTENCVLPGQTQAAVYTNNQNATALWYHDHAMNITRMTVQAGLAGTYLIRDDEEDALNLPSGQFEIPLMIRDLNLGVDANGNPTGRQLLKTEARLPVFYGPYTMVNGVIWPYLNVQARHYRFRLTNVSSARIFRFVLVDEGGNPVPNVMYQIGSDSGLLPAPVEIDVNGILLAPAERADILIDFTTLAGHNIRLMNIAPAPYAGTPLPPGSFPPAPNPSAHDPEPDVMQFRVAQTATPDGFTLPRVLSPSFTRLTDANVPAHTTRVLALGAQPGATPNSQLWELAPAPTGTTQPIIQLKDSSGTTTNYIVVAKGLEDTVNWFPLLNGWEEWQIINLTPVTHPIHLHLVKFQALARELYNVSGWNRTTGATNAGTPLTYTGPGVLDATEQGWKDTIRVYPGTMVRIAAQFPEYTGRYMYHCHLLDHEDLGMMRPFTVMPQAIEARMQAD
jgi:spore coat protein A